MTSHISIEISEFRRTGTGETGGYELRSGDGRDQADCIEFLEWLDGPGRERLPQAGFVVVRLDLEAPQRLLAFLAHTVVRSLHGRLCVASTSEAPLGRQTMGLLHGHGLMALLDDVNLDTRLGDISMDAYDAVRLHPDFVHGMAACPRTAASVTAAAALAHDLGMLCLADDICDDATRELLAECGIDYVGAPRRLDEPRAGGFSATRADTISVSSATNINRILR